jgi:hypothetical protein
MVGRIVWWSEYKTSGICSLTDEHGVVQTYFLLASKIVQRPVKIEPGYYVKFKDVLQPKRQGLLPTPINVVVSDHPFTDVNAGASAHASGAGAV